MNSCTRLQRGADSRAAHRCRPISCSMVSMATLVLPAPVGAHTSMFCDSGGRETARLGQQGSKAREA